MKTIVRLLCFGETVPPVSPKLRNVEVANGPKRGSGQPMLATSGLEP
jgi:hypothetical protein